MSLVTIGTNAEALERDLDAAVTGEVRFDKVSRALYSTDASVYQILPLGVVVPRTREDLVAAVMTAAKHRCSVTLRGGGTSQAGQAIGDGIQIDISKYYNRVLEVNAAERWCRVEPGIVLAELNAQLKAHGLLFAPDVSASSRARRAANQGGRTAFGKRMPERRRNSAAFNATIRTRPSFSP